MKSSTPVVICEPARRTPVACEVDLCVVGGSCTGVFAAVRAARLGSTVAIVESQGFFGGVATAGLVNIWHSLHDFHAQQQIIGGLTAEVIDRLRARDAVSHKESHSSAYTLNTEELKIELDALVRDSKVRPFLHARFVTACAEDGRLDAIVIEDKSGRRAIRARSFVDATGDGDVVSRMGLPTRKREDLQPPTACALLEGLAKVAAANPGFSLDQTVYNDAYPEALKLGFLWHSHVVGSDDLTMVAGTRVNHADCSDADQLTQAEMAARRQVRSLIDTMRNHLPRGREVFLRGLPSCIGIRETRVAACLTTLTETQLLRGERFPDAIANGTYRVDVHHSNRPGLTFRYLDGREEYVVPGQPAMLSRWREAGADSAAFYQIPFRALVPQQSRNVVVAGRLIDTDRGAFGATRVMVNCNQTGEAAGAACYLALRLGVDVQDVPADALRQMLREGGSIVV